MSVLVSPGVDVSIIDQSFYSTAGAGTVPLVVFATSANKVASSGSGIAPYTTPATAGQLYLSTSQRDLIQNFGNPEFKVVQGTPVQGYELNEYGLLAAYQYLGIANRCYVLRADIDLGSLEPSTSAPTAPPTAGTYWLNLAETQFGIFQSNANPVSGLAWASQTPLIATAANITMTNGVAVPSTSFGSNGNYAIAPTQSSNLLYQKISGAWYQVGSAAWEAEYPTVVTGTITTPSNLAANTTVAINGTTVSFSVGNGNLANAVSDINTAMSNASIPITASISSGALTLTNTAGGNITLIAGTGSFIGNYGIATHTYGVLFYQTNSAQYPANSVTGSVWIKGSTPNNGANWNVQFFNSATASWITVAAPFYSYNSALSDGNAGKDTAAVAGLGSAPAVGTLYVGYDATYGIQQLRRWNGTIWQNLTYEASLAAPTSSPAAGTYWYNADFAVDIMYGDGSQWNGYARKYPLTDPNGPILSGSQPIQQSTGNALVDHDLWVDTSDLENYPMVYTYTASTSIWNLIDNTDDTSPFGIIFADARQDSGTNYVGTANTGYIYSSTLSNTMVLSDFVDPDAPDARTYPDGMLLFNTRYSTYNVKEWMPTYFNAGNFDPNTDYTLNAYENSGGSSVFPALGSAGRWVTASGNTTSGAPYMGRKAQRAMVVRALEAIIATNNDIRAEQIFFNLIAVPGYSELLPEMISLNTDIKQIAFCVGDTPIRMDPSGTSVTKWATNGGDVAVTGEDGLTVADDYTGVYYPWGLSTDLSGNNVMIPPSAIALCTIAYNDQVAFPWYAPAGYRRGIVTNASSVGYLTAAGTYQPVILTPGQRDTLYSNKINPIAYLTGAGLVVYGQKTLEPTGTSALDRINVARLANYLIYNIDIIVKPFLFEQNDTQTQTSAAAVVSTFLNGLVGLQAISDYAVVCDSTNNTSATIAANELWIDVAIVPLYSIEFIYVPVRILSAGSSV